MTADTLKVGVGGITGQQVMLTANTITSNGKITVTQSDPAQLGLSLTGLNGGGNRTAILPLLVDMNSLVEVSPNSATAGIVFLAGPSTSKPKYASGTGARLIDYNGDLRQGAASTAQQTVSSLNSVYAVFSSNPAQNPNSPSANKSSSAKTEIDLRTGVGSEIDDALGRTLIVSYGLKLPKQEANADNSAHDNSTTAEHPASSTLGQADAPSQTKLMATGPEEKESKPRNALGRGGC